MIAKHNENHYLPCLTKLKLNMDEEGVVFMEGFLEAVEKRKYNWKNYFFIRQPDGVLYETGSEFNESVEYNEG